MPASQLRWACPRSWTAAPESIPDGPPRLWTQPRVVEELRSTALAFARGVVRHIEVAVPPGPDWVRIVAEALDGHGPGVHAAQRADEQTLRGRGSVTGLLAANDGNIVVLDVHEAKSDAVNRALGEAAIAGSVHSLDGKGDDSPAEPRAARVVLVVVGTDTALKKWRDDNSRVGNWALDRVTLESDADLNRTNARLLAERLRRFAAEAGLATPAPGALGRVIEGLRADARRGRLGDELTRHEDALLEAGRSGAAVDRRSVEAAIARIAERRAEREEAHRDRVVNGRLLLTTEDGPVGLVNGLVVYSAGPNGYAIPSRISARVAVGSEGVINVEREAKYSGRSFDKGVFQLTAYLRATFARDAPMAMVASLAVEQNYGRIDGDSATLAETLAVLSALSGLPCRQSVAITGAMNQRGEILPVGSVSLKVTGWWKTCKSLGYAGDAGVIVPSANVPDIDLARDLQREIGAGSFGLWAVRDVEQAVEVVFGRPAGVPDNGRYPEGSVFGLVSAALTPMSDRLYPLAETSPSRGRGRVEG